MEPVTYFTGFGVTILGYFWWSLTNSEYEYENVYDFVLQRKRNELYEARGFDLGRLMKLDCTLKECNALLKKLNVVESKPVWLQGRLLRLLQ